MKSKILILIVLVVGLAIGGFVFYKAGYFDSHSCDWCGNTPTKAFKVQDDSYSYACKRCSSECLYCGDKATKHGFNLFEMVIFMCDDCYEQQMRYQ